MGQTRSNIGRIGRGVGITVLILIVVAAYSTYLASSGSLYKIPIYNNLIKPVGSIVPNIGSLPIFSSGGSAQNSSAKTSVAAATTVRPVAVLHVNSSNQNRSIRISNTTEIDVTANYENLTIRAARGTTVYLNVASDHNNITIVNSTVYLSVFGSYNMVQLRNSTAMNSEITGIGNIVSGG